MTNFYSIIQYVPDPVSNERINVGVCTVGDDGSSQIVSVEDWTRVRQFAGTDVKVLRESVNDLSAQILDVERLKEYSANWTSSLQFTPPRSSGRPIPELLEWLTSRVLWHEESKPKVESKRDVLDVAKVRLAGAIANRGADFSAKYRVETNSEISGELLKHETDFSLHNGRPLLAGIAMSFSNKHPAALLKEIHLGFWTFEDIRRANNRVRCSMILASPQNSKQVEVLNEAEELLARVDSEVVRVEELDSWAATLVETLP